MKPEDTLIHYRLCLYSYWLTTKMLEAGHSNDLLMEDRDRNWWMSKLCRPDIALVYNTIWLHFHCKLVVWSKILDVWCRFVYHCIHFHCTSRFRKLRHCNIYFKIIRRYAMTFRTKLFNILSELLKVRVVRFSIWKLCKL